jgi:hypothetical protein
MTITRTRQGCTVQTTYTIQPNGTYTESVTLSVDPASRLAIVTEENAGQDIGTSFKAERPVPRFRR